MKNAEMNLLLKRKIEDMICDNNHEFVCATMYSGDYDLQFLTVHYIRPNDYPNGIEMNSICLQFTIDYNKKKVCCGNGGHVWLTPADMRKSNLAMTSVKHIADYNSVKWFHKKSFKDIDDLLSKIMEFYYSVLGLITSSTTGYPYKHLAYDIY